MRHRFATKPWKIIGTLALVAIAFLVFHVVDTDNFSDGLIIAIVIITYGFASLVIIFATDDYTWSVRTSGILLTKLGTCWLFIGIGLGRWFNHPFTHWQSDLLRSLYLVGGPLFLWGLLGYSGLSWGKGIRRIRAGVGRLKFWRPICQRTRS